MLEAQGDRKTSLHFDGHALLFKRSGMLAVMKEKRIPIESILSITLKPAGAFLSNGYIKFSTGAGEARELAPSITGEQENAMWFSQKQEGAVLAIKEAIEAAQKNIKKPNSGSALSVADELKKLLELKQLGVLSETEFEEQKKKLL